MIIPATLDGFKSRTAPPVELLVAEGVGPYPVDEGLEVEDLDEGPDEDVEVVLLAALAYGGRRLVTGETGSGRSLTYLESLKGHVGSGVNSKDHTSPTMAREEHQCPFWKGDINRCTHAPAPCLQ